MRSLQEDKYKLEGELRKAKCNSEAAEDKLAELRIQHENVQELMATLRDGKGATKVAEWHAKIGEIRLQDLKLNRAITRYQEQVKTFQLPYGAWSVSVKFSNSEVRFRMNVIRMNSKSGSSFNSSYCTSACLLKN